MQALRTPAKMTSPKNRLEELRQKELGNSTFTLKPIALTYSPPKLPPSTQRVIQESDKKMNNNKIKPFPWSDGSLGKENVIKDRLEEAKTCVQKVSVHLGSSRNLKTDSKRTCKP